jgi:small subunit ribosomal protein S6
LTQIYEGMFVLDNQVVREGWNDAKAIVTGTLEKHGGTVHTARRWDERRLAYPIEGRLRGTYLLAYYELPIENIEAMRRDFNLSEKVLRYLELSVDAVPEGERELAAVESGADFSVPEPPPDDTPEPEAESEGDDGDRDRRRDERKKEEPKKEEPEGESKDGESKDGDAKPDAKPEPEAKSEPEATTEPESAPAAESTSAEGEAAPATANTEKEEA